MKKLINVTIKEYRQWDEVEKVMYWDWRKKELANDKEESMKIKNKISYFLDRNNKKKNFWKNEYNIIKSLMTLRKQINKLIREHKKRKLMNDKKNK